MSHPSETSYGSLKYDVTKHRLSPNTIVQCDSVHDHDDDVWNHTGLSSLRLSMMIANVVGI